MTKLNSQVVLTSVILLGAILALLLATGPAHGREVYKRSSKGQGGPSATGGPNKQPPSTAVAAHDHQDDDCMCTCGLCYTKPEWRPPVQPNCTTFCIYRVKHYEPCFSGDICAPLDFVPVYDYYQIQIPSKVRGWNPQLMNGRLLTSTTTTTEPPPAAHEAEKCEFLDMLSDAKIPI